MTTTTRILTPTDRAVRLTLTSYNRALSRDENDELDSLFASFTSAEIDEVCGAVDVALEDAAA